MTTNQKGHHMTSRASRSKRWTATGRSQEAIENVSTVDSRAGFLAKATVATGGLIGGGAILGALASPASAATKNDVAIANLP